MRILLSTYGSRGDVEPMAALGAALIRGGAEAVVCAPPETEFVRLLARAGVPMVPAFSSVEEWVRKARESAWTLQEMSHVMADAHYSVLLKAAAGCDMVIATGLFPSCAASRALADSLGVPFAFVSFCPLLLPSTHHEPFAYPGHPKPAGVNDYGALWEHNAQAMQALYGDAVNSQRSSLGLPQLANVRDEVFGREPWAASDPVLAPWLATEVCDARQTGAWLLKDERPLAPEIETFLHAGPAPVYVGFGSMRMEGAREAARIALEAIRAHGKRVVLASGWAGFTDHGEADDCLVIGEVNQQALFPRMAAAVHHGGAGTTTTAARAGVPQVVVPQTVDQPYYAGRVDTLGIGVAHNGAMPTVATLNAALATALAPETAARALAVAKTVRADGADAAADIILRKDLGGVA